MSDGSSRASPAAVLVETQAARPSPVAADTAYGSLTLGACLRTRGRENGFDEIRLVAASLVLVAHAFPIVTGSNASEPLYRLSGGQATLGSLAVGIFFVISGFLISNSFEISSTVLRFVVKRALRIMPALIVVCLLSVLLLGPLTTTLPPGTYFADPGAWSFLSNIVFLPHDYGLPGVFGDHPIAAVNGSIWTLKFEVACYALGGLLLATRRYKLLAVLLMWVVSFAVSRLDGPHGGLRYSVDMGCQLFRFFGAGMVLYLLRDRIPLKESYAWGAAALCVAALATPLFNEAVALFGSYAVIAFGYLVPKRLRFVSHRGDISYGIYIYAFPAQQLVAPLCFGLAYGPWLDMALAFPLVVLASILSWIFVESPAMAMRAFRPRLATA